MQSKELKSMGAAKKLNGGERGKQGGGGGVRTDAATGAKRKDSRWGGGLIRSKRKKKHDFATAAIKEEKRPRAQGEREKKHSPDHLPVTGLGRQVLKGDEAGGKTKKETNRRARFIT